VAFERSKKESIFYTQEWYETFIREICPTLNAEIITIEAGTSESPDPILLIFFLKENRKICSLSNYYTSRFGIIGSASKKTFGRLIHKMIGNLLNEFPTVEQVLISPIRPEDSEYRLIVKAFKDQWWYVRPYFCFGNWFLENKSPEFTAYFPSLPPRIKNTLKRKERKFRRAGGLCVVYKDIPELRLALEAYHSVYSHSWKNQEPFPEFINGLVERFAEIDASRVGVAWLDNLPVAAQIWFVYEGVAYIFKLAFDERRRNFSPGTVLSAHMFKYVLETDRVDKVDYLSGDDTYKKDWMPNRREMWGMAAFNPKTLRGLVMGVGNLVSSLARKCRAR